MRERAKQLNGTLEIASDPSDGTTIRAILPLAQPSSLVKNVALEDQSDASGDAPRASQTKVKGARSSSNA
jgi:chemotaxis protein histidine kinase CheA